MAAIRGRSATALCGFMVVAVMLAGCNQPAPQTRQGLEFPHDYARADVVPDLLIEIDYVAGREPSRLALDGLMRRAHEMTDKVNITILPPTEIPPQSSQYGTYDNIEPYAIHAAFAAHCGQPRAWVGKAAVLHVLYLDGRSDPTLETQYQGLSVRLGECSPFIVMLPDYWAGSFGPVSIGGLPVEGTTEDLMERSVLVHEFGHALGLVDHGAPMTKERRSDDPCRCHSTSTQSVMYVGIDDPSSEQTLAALEHYVREGIEPIWSFDAHDIADVKALRERPRQ